MIEYEAITRLGGARPQRTTQNQIAFDNSRFLAILREVKTDSARLNSPWSHIEIWLPSICFLFVAFISLSFAEVRPTISLSGGELFLYAAFLMLAAFAEYFEAKEILRKCRLSHTIPHDLHHGFTLLLLAFVFLMFFVVNVAAHWSHTHHQSISERQLPFLLSLIWPAHNPQNGELGKAKLVWLAAGSLAAVTASVLTISFRRMACKLFSSSLEV